MFNYTIAYKEKGDIDYTTLNGAVRPFSMNDTLDESLDSGVVMVAGLDEKHDIRPFSMIRVSIVDSEVHHRYFKAGSVKTVKRRYQNGAYKYDVKIDLIELTKELERVVCDTMTFTNYLGKNYTGNPINPIVVEGTSYVVSENQVIYSPNGKGNSQVFKKPTQVYPRVVDLVSCYSDGGSLLVTDPTGNTSDYGDNETTIVFDKVGSWSITYNMAWGYSQAWPPIINYNTYTYNISVVDNIAPKTDWTISSVVKRLLSAGKTRRNGIEAQKYTLAAADEAYYSKIKAPEFYMTRSTLFDALMTVGGAIHAIPRLLEDNTITFTRLGGNEVKTIAEPLIYEEREWNAEDYCGAFDSTVENMLNTVDRIQGAVTEPGLFGFKTVRCSPSDVKINADSMCILTDFPINQVTKLEVQIMRGNTQYQADISAYVFEKAEYDALSGYKGAVYPYSKAYALCYSQGDNKVTGLNFRLQGATEVSSAFNKYAIYNIFYQTTGVELADTDYVNLAFRIQYIPSVTARVKQLRPNLSINNGNELIFNQSGNSVEGFYYGEKLRGAAARLGNETVTRTYAFGNYNDIPKAGDLVDVDGVKMYVAIVNVSCDTNYIRATIIMTANYNKLSEFVGIDSNYRLYDVSEKQSVDRLVNYGEMCLISNSAIDSVDNRPLITRHGIDLIKNTFAQKLTNFRPLCATIISLLGNTVEHIISKIRLPMSGGGIGNSVYFTFDYLDNYGAGYQSISAEGTPIETANNRLLRNVPYGDVYGEATYMAVSLWDGMHALKNELPQEEINYTVNEAFCTGRPTDEANSVYSNPLIIQKDSREHIGITIQLHFVTATPDIIVGKALTQDNLLITERNSEKAGVLYLLPEKLNALRQTLDLTEAYNTGIPIDNLISTGINLVTIAAFTNPSDEAKTYKAWAIVNPLDNTFYIGRNEDLGAGDTSTPIYMNFVDNSYEQ